MIHLIADHLHMGSQTGGMRVGCRNRVQNFCDPFADDTLIGQILYDLVHNTEGAIGPPPDGFKSISTREIMEQVKTRYGRVDATTFARMEEVLATPLDHVQNLEKHVATQKGHMLMQTSAGYPLEEYRKVLNFRKKCTFMKPFCPNAPFQRNHFNLNHV